MSISISASQAPMQVAVGYGLQQAAYGMGLQQAAYGTGLQQAVYGTGMQQAAYGMGLQQVAYGTGPQQVAYGTTMLPSPMPSQLFAVQGMAVAEAAPPPPVEPRRLTLGLPDPETIEAQKAAYHRDLEEQMRKGEDLLVEQQKKQTEYLRQAAEVQKRQALSQIDQQARQHEIMLQQKYSQEIGQLQQQTMHSKLLLEKQASELAQEFQKRKLQEEVMEREYAARKQLYDEQMKATTELQRQRRKELLLHQPALWLYCPEVLAPIDTREEPDVGARRTQFELQPGDTFFVCEEKLGEDGVLYLKLADGRGWLFDRKPGVGTMCILQRDPGHAGMGMGGSMRMPLQTMLGTGCMTHCTVPMDAIRGPQVYLPGTLPGAQQQPPGATYLPGTLPGAQQQWPGATNHRAQVPLATSAGVLSQWLYSPEIMALLDIRATPDVNGPRTSITIKPGEVLSISEELEGKDGVLYLRLTDGRGWVFDRKPNCGVMCVRHPAASPCPAQLLQPPLPSGSFTALLSPPSPVMSRSSSFTSGHAGAPLMPQHLIVRNQSQPTTLTSQWLYSPEVMVPMEVRAVPEVEGQRTQHKLQPGEVFGVSEEKESEEGILFLKLADGRGWVFDRKPGKGVMCVRAPQPAQALPVSAGSSGQYRAAPTVILSPGSVATIPQAAYSSGPGGSAFFTQPANTAMPTTVLGTGAPPSAYNGPLMVAPTQYVGAASRTASPVGARRDLKLKNA